MLDPVETAPVHEAWLLKNREAKQSLERGLEESSKNKTKYLGSFQTKDGIDPQVFQSNNAASHGND